MADQVDISARPIIGRTLVFHNYHLSFSIISRLRIHDLPEPGEVHDVVELRGVVEAAVDEPVGREVRLQQRRDLALHRQRRRHVVATGAWNFVKNGIFQFQKFAKRPVISITEDSPRNWTFPKRSVF